MNEITMKLNADRLIRMALEEDITSEDITTNSVMREKQRGEVQLLCKETGIIAGIWVFERVFTLLDENTETEFYVKDGDKVEKGQLLGIVKGRYPGAPFRRADCPELSPEDERYCHLYPPDRRSAQGQQDKTSGYQEDYSQHADL